MRYNILPLRFRKTILNYFKKDLTRGKLCFICSSTCIYKYKNDFHLYRQAGTEPAEKIRRGRHVGMTLKEVLKLFTKTSILVSSQRLNQSTNRPFNEV